MSITLSVHSPNTQGFIQKYEEEKAKLETEDNRSFLQKYVSLSVIHYIYTHDDHGVYL